MAVFPLQAFTADNIKLRWKERYTSEALNQKFLGMPRGVYAGFRPAVSSSTHLDLTVEPNDGYSLIRVQSSSEPVMVDILTTDTVSLDFTGHATWPVYVIASASYAVGLESSGQLFTRETPSTGPTEVTVCKVDRPGNTGDIIPSPSLVFPTSDIVSRQEPYAFDDLTTITLSGVTGGPPAVGDTLGQAGVSARVMRVAINLGSVDVALIQGTSSFAPGAVTFQPSGATASMVGSAVLNPVGQRFGFMPKGSKEQLDVAYTTAEEVVAARTEMDNTVAPIFDPNNAQTTGLPERLRADLSGVSMAGRLGKASVNVMSNSYVAHAVYRLPTAAFAGDTPDPTDLLSIHALNVSGSFSAKVRSSQSTASRPSVDMAAGGNETTYGAITATSVVGFSSDIIRNTCYIIREDTRERLTDSSGTVVYGRLKYLADDLLAGTLTFNNSSTSVSGSGTAFLANVFKGDIIQGPDGLFYEVTSNPSSNYATLNPSTNTALEIFPAYAGAGPITTPAGSVKRRRYSLEFFTRTSGTDSPAILPTLTSFRFFFPAFLTLDTPNFDSTLLMLGPGAPVVPLATDSIYGRALLAANLGTTAATAVQGNDARVNTPIQGVGVSGRYEKLIAGSNVVLSGGANLVISVPGGGVGGAGPTGPAGIGFQFYETKTSALPSIATGPQTGTIPFTFSSMTLARMASATIGLSAQEAAAPALWISDIVITPSSNVVTVTWNADSSGLGNIAALVVCSAAGG